MEKCRRRWDLADAEFLKYKYMNVFDRAMNHIDKAYSFSDNEHQYVSRKVLFGPYSEASGSHQHFARISLAGEMSPAQCDASHAQLSRQGKPHCRQPQGALADW